jgi:hypothetical protein
LFANNTAADERSPALAMSAQGFRQSALGSTHILQSTRPVSASSFSCSHSARHHKRHLLQQQNLGQLGLGTPCKQPRVALVTSSRRSIVTLSSMTDSAAFSSEPDATDTSGDGFNWPSEIQPGTDGAEGFDNNTSGSSSSLSSSVSGGSTAPPWAAQMPTWNASTRKHLHHMMDLFTLADRVRVFSSHAVGALEHMV